MPAKPWHWTLTSKYYWKLKKWVQKIDIGLLLCLKMRYDIHRIMLHSKSTFSGWIQMANPMHPDAVTSGCDRGGSTTSL